MIDDQSSTGCAIIGNYASLVNGLWRSQKLLFNEVARSSVAWTPLQTRKTTLSVPVAATWHSDLTKFGSPTVTRTTQRHG